MINLRLVAAALSLAAMGLAECATTPSAQPTTTAAGQEFGPYAVVPADAPAEGYPKVDGVTDAHLGLPKSRIHGWKPKEKITPPSWTEEEKAAEARRKAEQFFQEKVPKDLPTIELGPYLGFDEGMAKQAECAKAKGFPVVVVSRGFAYDPGVPVAQDDALNMAHYECAMKYPYDPVFARGSLARFTGHLF
ncbi:hypothetical protein BSZ39_01760 [Bowdeniella nasicola]|uniref:Uncharacterized protein n=1 Tax=Bowdeniella nasicola TaxID=208480 RepID=A0A1Q5Q4X2_9ACTO|nr:hypothetical protein [Bowdeniella nasicola]OKL54833.1 hypothetical protein BSZ39_01760 [Bowdeniella nasicola]